MLFSDRGGAKAFPCLTIIMSSLHPLLLSALSARSTWTSVIRYSSLLQLSKGELETPDVPQALSFAKIYHLLLAFELDVKLKKLCRNTSLNSLSDKEVEPHAFRALGDCEACGKFDGGMKPINGIHLRQCTTSADRS